jgi:hypothetical protein
MWMLEVVVVVVVVDWIRSGRELRSVRTDGRE